MKKIKTTGFWISLSGAVMLVVQTILGAFGITFNSEIVNTIVSAICGVLVLTGVLIPTKSDSLTINLPGLEDKDEGTQQNLNESLTESVEETKSDNLTKTTQNGGSNNQNSLKN